MKYFKFKQAIKFEQKGGRKFFSLGVHPVSPEIEKLDYFQLLKKHGLIVESGAPAPSHQESQKMAIDKKMAQSEVKADASESGDAASDVSSGADSSAASESSEVSEEKESRKNRKNRR